jgi:hypothetical protein
MPIFLLSCSDKSTDPTNNSAYQLTCVINGAGYSNQTFTFDVAAGAIYNPQENISGCSFANAAGDAAALTFEGNSKGEYEVNDSNNNFVISMNGTNVVFGLTSGKINVTTYGSVGGDVAGTFSGSGIVISSGAQFNVQITNGVFKAKRLT